MFTVSILCENVLNYMGMLYQTLGDFDQAIDTYTHALAVYGERAEPYHNLALIY